MSIDWGPVIIVGGLMGAMFAGIWIASQIDKGRQRAAAAMRREQNLYAPYITQALVDEAEYIVRDALTFPDDGTTQWPDLCAEKPCDWEDNYQCKAHRPPRGRHHVVHVITDLPEPSDPRWRQ